jgi:glutathione peroxidase-family protein
MSKSDVNGPNTSEVYKWLRMNSELYFSQFQQAQDIPWNYAKFIVIDGKVDSYYESTTDPVLLTDYIADKLQVFIPIDPVSLEVSGRNKRVLE